MNIFEWLTNPNPKYTDGIELYKQFYPRDKKYIAYFKQVDDSKKGQAHFNMLFNALSRYARVHPEAKNTVIEPKKIGVDKIVLGKKTRNPKVKKEEIETPERKRIRIAGEFDLVNPKDLPKELQLVFFDVKERFANMKELHRKIKDANNTDDVSGLTQELVDLEEINYKEWGKIDAVLKDGKSSKKKVGPRSLLTEFADNERRIKTININFPRAKKDLEKLGLEKDGCKDAKTLKKINKKITRRNKSMKDWDKELKTLTARQLEIKNVE